MTTHQLPRPIHTAAVQAIAEASTTGLKHPGNPDTNTPPAAIMLTMFRTHGMPPPMIQAAREAATTWAESIVWLIENDLDSRIIGRGELEQLHADLASEKQAREELTEQLENLAVRMNLP